MPGDLAMVNGWIDHHNQVSASQDTGDIGAGERQLAKTGGLAFELYAAVRINEPYHFLKGVVQANFITQPGEITGKSLTPIAGTQNSNFNGHPAPSPDRGYASAFRWYSAPNWRRR